MWAFCRDGTKPLDNHVQLMFCFVSCLIWSPRRLLVTVAEFCLLAVKYLGGPGLYNQPTPSRSHPVRTWWGGCRSQARDFEHDIC